MSWDAARETTRTVASEPDASHLVALDNGPATIAKVGGKGVSLARMARAGLPVPIRPAGPTAGCRRGTMG